MGPPEQVSLRCPNCGHGIDEKLIRKMWGQLMSASRKRSGKIGNNRFSRMTEEERSAEATRAAQIRWTKVRAERHQSIAAPVAPKPQKHSVLESLDAIDALLHESKADERS